MLNYEGKSSNSPHGDNTPKSGHRVRRQSDETGQHLISTNIRQLQAAIRSDPSKVAAVRFLKLTWTNDDHAHHPPAFRSVGSESNTNYHGNMLFAARNLTGAGIEQILQWYSLVGHL